MFVKQREWYQPFAPSMLEEEAKRLLEDIKGADRFMTMAYKVKDGKEDVMKSAVHIDSTARPQMVGKENMSYRRLTGEGEEGARIRSGPQHQLQHTRHAHSDEPEDALLTMKKTKTRHMFLGGYYVENKGA